MEKRQKAEVLQLFKDVKNRGELDYVTCWFLKSTNYILNTEIKVSFVSTNSISQGEQVGILWDEILKKKVEIFFAHKTFKWTIDERKVIGMHLAKVYVVIIGFSQKKIGKKYLYFYENINSDPIQTEVKEINPYLVEASNTLIRKRKTKFWIS